MMGTWLWLWPIYRNFFCSFYRYTNLKKLFGYPYLSTNQSPLTESAREDIQSKVSQYVDAFNANSCVVMVNGRYDEHLSRLSGLSTTIEVECFRTHDRSTWKSTKSTRSDAASDANREATIRDCLKHVPDEGELARNSYGSDQLTMLNLVGRTCCRYPLPPHLTACHCIDRQIWGKF